MLYNEKYKIINMKIPKKIGSLIYLILSIIEGNIISN